MTTTLTSTQVSPSNPGATPAGSAASRPGAVLTVILLGYFMAVLDVAIVNVALPTIRSTLHSSGAGLELGSSITAPTAPLDFSLEGLIRDERGVRMAPESDD